MNPEDEQAMREFEDFRAGASERGGAMVMLRHDLPGEQPMLEQLFLGTERQGDGLISLRCLDADSLRLELVAYEDDLRRVLDEPLG